MTCVVIVYAYKTTWFKYRIQCTNSYQTEAASIYRTYVSIGVFVFSRLDSHIIMGDSDHYEMANKQML